LCLGREVVPHRASVISASDFTSSARRPGPPARGVPVCLPQEPTRGEMLYCSHTDRMNARSASLSPTGSPASPGERTAFCKPVNRGNSSGTTGRSSTLNAAGKSGRPKTPSAALDVVEQFFAAARGKQIRLPLVGRQTIRYRATSTAFAMPHPLSSTSSTCGRCVKGDHILVLYPELAVDVHKKKDKGRSIEIAGLFSSLTLDRLSAP